jgi:hypothetical protein
MMRADGAAQALRCCRKATNSGPTTQPDRERLAKTMRGLVEKWTAASDWIVVGKVQAENMLTDVWRQLPTITAPTTVLYA